MEVVQVARGTTIQRLINKVDRINCNEDGDILELNEVFEELGRELYRRSLMHKEYVITIKNPRNN